MGRLKRLLGFEKYEYHPVEWDRDIETTTRDIDGVLMKITPYPENNGILAAAGLLQSIHDAHTRGVHSFEIWFVDGRIQFFVRAADEEAADRFRRRISSNYSDSDVLELEAGDVVAFPHIREGEYLAGATVKKEHPQYNVDYLPIRHFKDGEGWEQDPYKEVLGSMLSDDETRVIVQVTMQAVPESWTQKKGIGDMSVDEVADTLRQPRVKGWINPREIEPNKKDKDAAKLVEEARHKPAFGTNIRVLAISENPREASNRAAGVSRTFKKYYNSVSEMGLRPTPIDGRTKAMQRRRMRKHVKRMRDRSLADDGSILTVEELAGVAHIPEGDIPTPQIEWKYSRSGEDVPADAPGHTVPDEVTR